jgi:hypothetical protein
VTRPNVTSSVGSGCLANWANSEGEDVVNTNRDPDKRQSIWERMAISLQSFPATIAAATITSVAGIIVAIAAAIFGSKAPSSTKPAHPHPFNYFPYLLVLIGVVALIVLAVGFIAARAGIRKRERRLDIVERLLLPETLTADDLFTNDARTRYLAVLGQFAKDVVELSKTISHREASDVVTARHVGRASELLSVGSVSRRGNYMGSIGGVLLGAGIANFFVLLSSSKPSPLETGLTFAASIVGVVLLAYQWFSG